MSSVQFGDKTQSRAAVTATRQYKLTDHNKANNPNRAVGCLNMAEGVTLTYHNKQSVSCSHYINNTIICWND